MPRGKKTPPEVVYGIIASWAVTGNYKETSRELNIPVATVKKIVDENKDKPEFEKLCNEKKADFAEKATDIINKGMRLLDRRFERAIEQEENFDVLINEIFATDREEISQDEKIRLVNKLRALQLHDIKAITTAIGTMYDKRALAKGEATENTRNTIEIIMPDEGDEYAG